MLLDAGADRWKVLDDTLNLLPDLLRMHALFTGQLGDDLIARERPPYSKRGIMATPFPAHLMYVLRLMGGIRPLWPAQILDSIIHFFVLFSSIHLIFIYLI